MAVPASMYTEKINIGNEGKNLEGLHDIQSCNLYSTYIKQKYILCSFVLVPQMVGGVILVPVPAPATTVNVSTQSPVVFALGWARTKFLKSSRT